MATRASIIFKEGGRPMAAIYKQYDGYPEGLGAKLKEIVAGGQMVNGCLPGDELGKRFNGAGCLFATVIQQLKRTVGDVYICHPDDVGHQGEDYIYEMNEKGGVGWAEIG